MEAVSCRKWWVPCKHVDRTTKLRRTPRLRISGPGRVEVIHVGEQEHTGSSQLHRSQRREVVVVTEAHAVCVGGVVLVDDRHHASFQTRSNRVTNLRPALLLQKIALACNSGGPLHFLQTRDPSCSRRRQQGLQIYRRVRALVTFPKAALAVRSLTNSCAILSPTVSKSSEYLQQEHVLASLCFRFRLGEATVFLLLSPT